MKTTFSSPMTRRALLILPIILATTAGAADLPHVMCVLVEHAQIEQHPLVEERAFGHANYGHQVVVGAHSVLAIRIYENGSGPPDSQSFKKATLEIESPTSIQVGKDAFVNVFRSYYSEGGSAWVKQGGYSWASDPFHGVLLRRDINGLRVNLKLRIETTDESAFDRNPRKKQILIDRACPLQQQSVTELTPWVGMVGTTPLSFYGPVGF